jgi:hypothetical protein
VNSFMYKFAMLISILSFVLCIYGGISMFTGIFRSVIVFIGILFTFFLAGQIINLVLVINNRKPKMEDE